MAKWISGQQLLNDYDLKGFELFYDGVKKGLQPYSNLGKQISPSDVVDKITNITGLKEQHQELKFTRLEMGKDDVNEFDATIGHELLTHIEDCEKWALSVKDVDWNAFELPNGEAEATAVLKELIESQYLTDAINEFFGVPEIEPQKAAPAKSVRQSTKDKIEVQRVAKKLFDKHPELDTYEKFLNMPEIMEAGGKHYEESTRQKWISKVAPERLKNPGIRPKNK